MQTSVRCRLDLERHRLVKLPHKVPRTCCWQQMGIVFIHYAWTSHLSVVTAESYARSAAAVQMSAFRRWGVMADWQRGCYFTLDRQYEADQLELFFTMLDRV